MMRRILLIKVLISLKEKRIKLIKEIISMMMRIHLIKEKRRKLIKEKGKIKDRHGIMILMMIWTMITMMIALIISNHNQRENKRRNHKEDKTKNLPGTMIWMMISMTTMRMIILIKNINHLQKVREKFNNNRNLGKNQGSSSRILMSHLNHIQEINNIIIVNHKVGKENKNQEDKITILIMMLKDKNNNQKHIKNSHHFSSRELKKRDLLTFKTIILMKKYSNNLNRKD